MRARVWQLSALLACSLLQLGCDPGSQAGAEADSTLPPPAEPPTTAVGGAGPLFIPPPVPAPEPLFEGQTVRAQHSAPVVGGTLLVTRDGSTIAAADPDRDAIFLVNQASRVVTPLPLTRGDEPGRLVEGPDGTLFVALRRAGALIAIDAHNATIAQRTPVCASPRGVAYDAKSASVYVACRSGQLLTLDASTLSRKRTLQLDTDLRDVIVREHDLVVTRFTSAEVLVIAADGSVSRRAKPPSSCGEATVLYRALALPGGQVALAHQVSSNAMVGEGSGAYGGSPCGLGLVSRTLSTVDPDVASGSRSPTGAGGGPEGVDPEGDVSHSVMTFASFVLQGAGPLDIAFDAQGTRMAAIALDSQMKAVVAAKQNFVSAGPIVSDPSATLWVSPWDASVGAPRGGVESSAIKVSGQPIAVAFSPDGKYVVQSREPASLAFEDGTRVRLSDESHADSGHLMFHMNSGIGIACASCHPEGGDDGHVWRFPEGLRRTLPLEGGVLERAPFHWDGTLGDMGKLVNAVMVTRMGLPQAPNDEQISALGAFLEQLPPLPPEDGLDSAAVVRGEAIFRREDVACATCHAGPQYTDNRLVDVGTGGKFVTPTLLGVGLRPALFHDGCAKSIAQRFGVCGGTAHGKPELLSTDERADLITFLRSL
ncbi:MAG TPA: cytochrome-c peroxidase [Polyangiaceae bacterium]|nr:cytochrome-c peroxidase [Polyangiaceae bacterium]